MIRAAAYVRTASFEHLVPELEPDVQRQRLARYIAERGWEPAGVYEDIGPAGSLPGLEAALAGAGSIDRLVILRLDRLAGNTRRILRRLSRLQDSGCELVSLDEDFDTGAPSGEPVRSILEGLARARPEGMGQCGSWTADLVRRHSVAPATVIDVGVGTGTPALYEAFPDAHFVLIEPLREFEPDIAAITKRLDAEYVPTAVGSEPGEATLHLTNALHTTSALARRGITTTRRVQQTTLDALMNERGWPPPYCLKIDVEGYELAVIEGARELLGQTVMVIAEVSVTGRFEIGPTSADVIAAMRSRGFVVVDVIDVMRGDGVHADLVFKPGSAG